MKNMRSIPNNNITNYLISKGVPKLYIKETKVDTYPVKFDELLKIIETRSLYLYGSVGTGKTQLAVDLMAEIAELKREITSIQGYEVERYNPKLFRFYSMPELLIKIRDTFKDDSKMEDFYLETDEYEYLIIDDFGVQKTSEWVQETLYVLINRRYGNMMKMIISSNKTIAEIAGEIDDRIASRLIEMSEFVKFEGKDRRIR